MSDISRAGNLGVIPQGVAYSFAPRQGYTSGQEIAGEYMAMLGASASLASVGIPHNFKQDGVNAKIPITGGALDQGGAAEVPADSWQLLENEVHKDIFESPNALIIEAAKLGSLGAI